MWAVFQFAADYAQGINCQNWRVIQLGCLGQLMTDYAPEKKLIKSARNSSRLFFVVWRQFTRRNSNRSKWRVITRGVFEVNIARLRAEYSIIENGA